MELSILVNGQIVKLMVKDYLLFQTKQNMKDSGIIINYKAREKYIMLMEILFKDNLLLIKLMDLVYINIIMAHKMEEVIKDFGSMMYKMVMGCKNGLMEALIKGNLKMV